MIHKYRFVVYADFIRDTKITRKDIDVATFTTLKKSKEFVEFHRCNESSSPEKAYNFRIVKYKKCARV